MEEQLFCADNRHFDCLGESIDEHWAAIESAFFLNASQIVSHTPKRSDMIWLPGEPWKGIDELRELTFRVMANVIRLSFSVAVV